jgi:dihydroorotate dehydrogenase
MRIIISSGNWVKDIDQIRHFCEMPAINGIVLKTCTLQPSAGNPPPNFADCGSYCVNNMGLPNYGFAYYSRIYESLASFNKEIILSIDGSSIDDAIQMIREYQGPSIEINLSCANRKNIDKPTVLSNRHLRTYFECIRQTIRSNQNSAGEDTSGAVHGKEITAPLIKSADNCPAEDSSQSAMHAREFMLLPIKSAHLCPAVKSNMMHRRARIGIKLPPLFYEYKIRAIAEILNDFRDIISWIVCCNTIPNAYVVDHGIHGSLSGEPCKAIALGNIRIFQRYLIPEIEIRGGGGIMGAQDIADYSKIGVKTVYLATGYIKDPQIVDRLRSKL